MTLSRLIFLLAFYHEDRKPFSSRQRGTREAVWSDVIEKSRKSFLIREPSVKSRYSVKVTRLKWDTSGVANTNLPCGK